MKPTVSIKPYRTNSKIRFRTRVSLDYTVTGPWATRTHQKQSVQNSSKESFLFCTLRGDCLVMNMSSWNVQLEFVGYHLLGASVPSVSNQPGFMITQPAEDELYAKRNF